MKCPACAKFLAKVNASVNLNGDILKVEGICKKHGVVEPTDWDYEDFFPVPTTDAV